MENINPSSSRKTVSSMILRRSILATFVAVSLISAATQKTKLLLLGDSITHGTFEVTNQATNSTVAIKPWRAWLNEIAPAGQEQYEFVGLKKYWVGSKGTYAGVGICNEPLLYADRHGAQCGATTEEIKAWFDASKSEVRLQNPAKVLIATGTNNIGQLQTVDAAIGHLSDLIKDVRVTLPNSKIIVATMASNQAAGVTVIDSYNQQVFALVRNLQKTDAKITVLDWSTTLTSADLWDGVHPNEIGAKKLAFRARAAITGNAQLLMKKLKGG